MNNSETESHTSSTTLAWVLIALGTVAIALGLWDVLVEQDGENSGSIVAIAIGVLVIALGIQRRRTG